MTPLIRRFRDRGHAMLREARELRGASGAANRTYYVRRAMREARYAFTCAARVVHVHNERGPS